MKAITLLPLFLAGTNALANNAPSDFHLNQQQLQKQKQDCTKACAQDDLDCRAICDHAPHPKPIHMNLMTECVHHCDVLKGKGSAAEITSYNQCHNSCINGYMALGEKKAPETKTWVDLVTPTPVIAVQETGNAEVSFEASGVSEASASIATGSGTTFTNGIGIASESNSQSGSKPTGTDDSANASSAPTTTKSAASASPSPKKDGKDSEAKKAASSGASPLHSISFLGAFIGLAVVGTFSL